MNEEDKGRRLLGKIGETIIIYELFKHYGWESYQNEQNGFDVLAINKSGKQIKIEVKTRYSGLQPAEEDANKKSFNRVFDVSKNELKVADYVICYLYPIPNQFIIIPITDIPKSGRISLSFYKVNGKLSELSKYKKYLNNWDILQ